MRQILIVSFFRYKATMRMVINTNFKQVPCQEFQDHKINFLSNLFSGTLLEFCARQRRASNITLQNALERILGPLGDQGITTSPTIALAHFEVKLHKRRVTQFFKLWISSHLFTQQHENQKVIPKSARASEQIVDNLVTCG